MVTIAYNKSSKDDGTAGELTTTQKNFVVSSYHCRVLVDEIPYATTPEKAVSLRFSKSFDRIDVVMTWTVQSQNGFKVFWMP